MTPWLVLTVLVAAINLAGLLVLRGRWGRIVALLAPASLVGTAAGNAVGDATGLEVLRIGDFHLVAASVGAQLAMVATLLLVTLAPSSPTSSADGTERSRRRSRERAGERRSERRSP